MVNGKDIEFNWIAHISILTAMYVLQCVAVHVAVVIIEGHGSGFGSNKAHCFFEKKRFWFPARLR